MSVRNRKSSGVNITAVTKKIIRVHYDKKQDMIDSFVRIQEFYESPTLSGKIFTLGKLADEYSRYNGAWDYHIQVEGCNIPSKCFEPFIKGLFDPLTKKEQEFIDLFRYRTDDFYVIGTHGESEEDMKETVIHEICHGLYGTNEEYKRDVDLILNQFNEELKNIRDFVKKMGYSDHVLEDEIHAFVSADCEYLKSEGVDVNKEAELAFVSNRESYFGALKIEVE